LNGHYGAIIKDLEGKTISQLKFPIYALEKKSNKFLSLNFSRLERLRPGYGYNNLIDETKNIFEPKDDGIFQGDLLDDNFNLIVSIKDIAHINRIKSMENSMHYINHISYSPDNSLAIFFHLWVDKSNVKHSRAMLLDIKKNEIKELVSPQYTPSHFCWVDNHTLIFTLARGHNGIGYYKISIKDKTINSINGLTDNVLDGHPTYLQGNKIITDTTPDMFLDRHLFSFDLNTSKKIPLGKFYSPLKFVAKERCDLHPRVSKKYICIDSSHQEQRGLYILKRKDRGIS